MSTTFFTVGAVIFAVYMGFTAWNINNGAKGPGPNWPTNGGEGCDLPGSNAGMAELNTKKERV